MTAVLNRLVTCIIAFAMNRGIDYWVYSLFVCYLSMTSQLMPFQSASFVMMLHVYPPCDAIII